MNKIIALSLLFFCKLMIAQPLLNFTDYNPIGSSNVYSANPNGFSAGLTGANQVWNYSNLGLTANGTSVSSLELSAPFASSFPEANYYIKTTSNGNDVFTIYKSTNSKLEILGVTTNSSILINFSPNPQTQFEFPFTFNLSISDSYATTFDPSTNNPFSIIYDSYGTLITPFGSYSNVFRTKKMDGAFPTFTWYTINPTLVVLSARFGSGGANSVIFYENNNLSTTQINELKSFNIFPNPSNKIIKISSNQVLGTSFSYKIFDLSGRELSSNISKFNDEINIEYLKSGHYIIQIIDENNSYSNHKFLKK